MGREEISSVRSVSTRIHEWILGAKSFLLQLTDKSSYSYQHGIHREHRSTVMLPHTHTSEQWGSRIHIQRAVRSRA